MHNKAQNQSCRTKLAKRVENPNFGTHVFDFACIKSDEI